MEIFALNISNTKKIIDHRYINNLENNAFEKCMEKVRNCKA